MSCGRANSRSLCVAVVDDEPQQRAILRSALEENGYAVVEGCDGDEAVELARSNRLDAMILDVRMAGMSGLEALGIIRRERPEIRVILLTAFIDVRDAVAAIKTGAHDYLEKPVDLDELAIAVDEALGVERAPRAPAEIAGLPDWIVAHSPAMLGVLRDAARVAPTDASILIRGESGTGKEVLARFIHERSRRAGGPFVPINCGAIPEALIESELFGHERGSFTGAVATRPGWFEQASGGTILLDEIGEMPPALQPRLLRVLEERRVRRIGGARELEIDARLVAATHRDLEEDVRQGRFREDLYYRLNVIALRLPPLRERAADVLPMAERFLAEQGLGGKRFSPAAQRLLLGYGWPGNVRELRNAVVRAAIIAGGALILPEDLPETLRAAPARPEAESSVLVGNMDEIQRHAILEALGQTGGNKTQAARLLGISRRNLVYKLRSYGM
ncbi:MAG: sigma-54 dependent transcriptional regulator [Candidatus Sumerlaeia bacterium]